MSSTPPIITLQDPYYLRAKTKRNRRQQQDKHHSQQHSNDNNKDIDDGNSSYDESSLEQQQKHRQEETTTTKLQEEEEEDDEQQYYEYRRPRDETQILKVFKLLERPNLTEQDVRNFCMNISTTTTTTKATFETPNTQSLHHSINDTTHPNPTNNNNQFDSNDNVPYTSSETTTTGSSSKDINNSVNVVRNIKKDHQQQHDNNTEIIEQEIQSGQPIIDEITTNTDENDIPPISLSSKTENDDDDDDDIIINKSNEICYDVFEKFMNRRKEIHELQKKLRAGTARIDSNYRLVPINDNDDDDNDEDENDRNNNNNNNTRRRRVAGGNNNNNINNNNNVGGAGVGVVGVNDMGGENQQHQHPLSMEQQEVNSALRIARLVKHYREIGVPDSELKSIVASFQLPTIPDPQPNNNNHRNNNHNNEDNTNNNDVRNVNEINNNNNNNNINLTLRRIFFAIGAVVTAFFCIIIQTLPLFHSASLHSDESISSIYSTNTEIDSLLYDILRIQPMINHIKQCPNLTRSVIKSTKPSYHDHAPFARINLKNLQPYNDIWYRRSSLYRNHNNNLDGYTDSIVWWFYYYNRYRILNTLYRLKIWLNNEIDCNDGILHIPTTTKLRHELVAIQGHQITNEIPPPNTTAVNDDDSLKILLQSFVSNGVHATWFIPCIGRPQKDRESQNKNPTCISSKNTTTQSNMECSVTSIRPDDGNQQQHLKEQHRCFRGVHDYVIISREVQNALKMGVNLIEDHGGDHFDIHENVQLLYEQIPTVVTKITSILQENYLQSNESVEPVAFRVNSVGPMNGDGVPLYGIRANNYLVRTFNRTNYLRWMERSIRHNDIAKYSLPWPFRFIRPKRDTCNLMADQEVDTTFHIHTTIFLSEGSGHDYTGGTALFVDDDFANTNKQSKLQRGIVIDGSVGRLLINTGGFENLRCRFPVRAGIRTTLQIWWKRY